MNSDSTYESKHETVMLANADYEEQWSRGVEVVLRTVERKWKLKAGRLISFRANSGRRSFGVVSYVKTNTAIRKNS